MKKENITILVIVLISLVYSVAFCSMRGAVADVDEFWSFSFANSHTEGYIPSESGWVSSEYFKNFLTVQENEIFDYAGVYNVTQKSDHPPMYFWILNFICSFAPNTLNIWKGLGLNILLYVLTTIMVFKLAKLLMTNKINAILTTIAFVFSTFAVNATLFIRMYTLVMFLSTSLTYYLVKYRVDNSKRTLAKIGILIVLGGLTHYHFYVFAFFMILCYLIDYLIHKQYKQLIILSCLGIVAVIITCLIYPHAVLQFWSDPNYSIRAHEVVSATNFSLFLIILRPVLFIFVSIIGVPYPIYYNLYAQVLSFLF